MLNEQFLLTIAYFVVGGLITVFTRRFGANDMFEQRAKTQNGNGKRSTGEFVMLQRLETSQDERIAMLERWRESMDSRFDARDMRSQTMWEEQLRINSRIEARLAGIEHALSLLSLKLPEVGQ